MTGKETGFRYEKADGYVFSTVSRFGFGSRQMLCYRFWKVHAAASCG
jgi:hypothetical protein